MIKILIRKTKVKYIDNQLARTRFLVAIDREQDKNSEDRGAEVPNLLVFERTVENCEKCLQKVSRVRAQGCIQIGRYTNKDDNKAYTTEFIADRVEFLNNKSENENYAPKTDDNGSAEMYDEFQPIEDEKIHFWEERKVVK